MSDLAIRSWNGTPISRRPADGFVNATAMCKANGKLWADFWRTDRCTQYLEALSGVMGFPITGSTGLVQAQRGGTDQGTWVHPDVATELARWISPEFSVFVNQWFREEYERRTQSQQAEVPRYTLTPIETANATLDVLERVVGVLSQCGGMDERDQILMKDIARDQLLKVSGGSTPALSPVGVEHEMSIADAWLQVTGSPMPRQQAGKIGKAIAKLYREEYNIDPPKRLQFIDGAPRLVNSYISGWLLRAVSVVSPRFLAEAS